MTIQEARTGSVPVIPDGAPFSMEQRAWLNGFFAGLLSLDAKAGISPLTGDLPDAAAKALAGDGDDGEAPWHDAAMPIDERMQLAEGRPLKRKLFAAMAQQDCGQCGYLCESYSAAIAAGTEAKLNLCVPGGKETSRMLKRLLEEVPAAPATPSTATPAQEAEPAKEPTQHGYSRDLPVEAVFRSAARLNEAGSEKDTRHVVLDISGVGPQLCTGRQLRALSDQRSASRRCGPGGDARAGGFSGGRQDVPAGADRGLRAGAGARYAARADRLPGGRGQAQEGQAARARQRSGWRCGHVRCARCPGGARADPSRSRSLPGVPGAAAAAPVFHFVLAARNAGRGAPDRRCGALRHWRPHAPGRRFDVPGRSAAVGLAHEGLSAEGARLRAAG